MIVAFLLKNWTTILFLAIVVGAGVYVEGLRVENGRMSTQITTLTDNNKILADNNAKLQTGIDASNKALDITGKAAGTAATNMVTLQSTITKQTADLKQHIATLLAAKAPVDCGSSINYLISNAKGYTK